jgi:hypothetical protein
LGGSLLSDVINNHCASLEISGLLSELTNNIEWSVVICDFRGKLLAIGHYLSEQDVHCLVKQIISFFSPILYGYRTRIMYYIRP